MITVLVRAIEIFVSGCEGCSEGEDRQSPSSITRGLSLSVCACLQGNGRKIHLLRIISSSTS